MASLHAPLPTLRRLPHGSRRTAWGQCGSLRLHCGGLPPLTPCRSPGALPTRLKSDTRPLPAADGAYAFGIVDQEVPGLSAGVDDVVVGVPNPGAELVLTQIVPDVFHWVQLGTVGRQGKQGEIGRHLQRICQVSRLCPFYRKMLTCSGSSSVRFLQ